MKLLSFKWNFCGFNAFLKGVFGFLRTSKSRAFKHFLGILYICEKRDTYQEIFAILIFILFMFMAVV